MLLLLPYLLLAFLLLSSPLLPRVSDMTGKLEKCKQFLPFLKRAGRMQGLVEYVASGSRFRVYIPRETCIITFLLGGISCPKGARSLPDGTRVEAEKFGDEAAVHVKEMVCLLLNLTAFLIILLLIFILFGSSFPFSSSFST